MGVSNPYYDVIIVGAGISGIGAAYHLQDKCPNKSFTILEGRESMGGTWDLFKYPGIRSDSDMYTLGFSFNPWLSSKSIADGSTILQYIKDTATKFGLDKKIQYSSMVKDASWSDQTSKWTLTVDAGGKSSQMECSFLFMCSGYYSYSEGYLPEFPGYNDFKGKIVHPQFWDEDLDYKDKNVVIIGSGATAVTLAPEMSKKAKNVVMLQRTPTYMITLPSEDKIALGIRKALPENTAYEVIRWKNILTNMGFYNAAQSFPVPIRKFLMKTVELQLGKHYKEEDFNPPYNPWDQRLCAVPDSDFFKAIKKQKMEIVTDHIQTFTKDGILLKSGKELKADIIVTATGLKLQFLGGMTVHVNGKEIQTSEGHVYRGTMISDVPNFAVTVGYTNSSWTLKCDLVSGFVTRILKYMDNEGYKKVVPKFDVSKYESSPLLDFDAGYVKRAAKNLPKQGSKAPWKVYQNYVYDLVTLKMSPPSDKHLEYA